MRVDGALGAYVQLPPQGLFYPAGGSYTTEAWIYRFRRGVSGYEPIVVPGENARRDSMIVATDQLAAWDRIQAGTLFLRQWHHCAITLEATSDLAGTHRLYIDGELVGTYTGALTASTFPEPLMIGYGGPNHLGYMSIRDVRIWNRVRTQEQIRRGMVEGISGGEQGLVAWYPLDQDARDYAGKGRPGPPLVDTFETPYATKALLDTGQAWLSPADALTPSAMPVAGGRAIFGPSTYVEKGVAVPSSNMRVAFTVAAENTAAGHILWVTPRWFSASSQVQIQIGATQVALGAVTFPAAIRVGGRYEAEIVGRVAVLRLDGVEIGRWTSSAWPLYGTRVYVGASQTTGNGLEDFVATPLELPLLDGTLVGAARPQLALR